jgi:hypothetical protein
MNRSDYAPRNPNKCQPASRAGSIVCACRRGYASVLDGYCVRCRGFELRGHKNLMLVLSRLPTEYKWPTIDYKELCLRVAVSHVTEADQ